MSKGQFLNQKLGKRMSRRVALAKSKMGALRTGLREAARGVRIPKRGNSREIKPWAVRRRFGGRRIGL